MNPIDINILTVDVGNTNCNFTMFSGDKIIYSFFGKTTLFFENSPINSINTQLDRFPLVVPDFCSVISVVPNVDSILAKTILDVWKVAPIFIDYKSELGMLFDVTEPHTIGIDRIINTFAAYKIHQCGSLIVDIGTAITWDIISPDGVFLGGAIAAGPQLMSKSLSIRSSLLPEIKFDSNFFPPSSGIGKKTESALSSGIFFGTIGMVDGVTKRIVKELNFDPLIIFTGGLSTLLSPFSKLCDVTDPMLTTKGIRLATLIQQTKF